MQGHESDFAVPFEVPRSSHEQPAALHLPLWSLPGLWGGEDERQGPIGAKCSVVFSVHVGRSTSAG
jgi:hypothetical protein